MKNKEKYLIKNRIICQNCSHYKKCHERMVTEHMYGPGLSPAICEDFVDEREILKLDNNQTNETLEAKIKELESKLKATEPNCVYVDEPLCPCCGDILDLCDNQCKCGQVLDLSDW